MKKLIKKLCIFLIPFVVLLAFFFAFEPYDYLSIKHNAHYGSKPISAMRELMNTKPDKIILGDSRMANLNTDYIREISGEDYHMMAFGGANLGESIDLFWFSAEHTDLEKVVYGLGSYGVFGQQSPGKIESARELVTHPLKFIGHFNYWMEAVSNAKRLAQNQLATWTGHPERMVWPEDPTIFLDADDPTGYVDQHIPHFEEYEGLEYRSNLMRYAEEDIVPVLQGIIQAEADMAKEQLPLNPDWDAKLIKDETLADLQEIIDYCDQNDIELIFVLPPSHESVRTLMLDPLGLTAENNRLRDFLFERATVYDMDFDNAFTQNDDNFFDGYHLVSAQKPFVTQLLFTDVESEYIVRHVHGR